MREDKKMALILATENGNLEEVKTLLEAVVNTINRITGLPTAHQFHCTDVRRAKMSFPVCRAGFVGFIAYTTTLSFLVPSNNKLLRIFLHLQYYQELQISNYTQP